MDAVLLQCSSLRCLLLLLLQDSPTLWCHEHFRNTQGKELPRPSAPHALWRLLPPPGETPRFYTADSSSKRTVLGEKMKPSTSKREAKADLGAPSQALLGSASLWEHKACGEPLSREGFRVQSSGICHRTTVLMQPPLALFPAPGALGLALIAATAESRSLPAALLHPQSKEKPWNNRKHTTLVYGHTCGYMCRNGREGQGTPPGRHSLTPQ